MALFEGERAIHALERIASALEELVSRIPPLPLTAATSPDSMNILSTSDALLLEEEARRERFEARLGRPLREGEEVPDDA